jgi:hypothetical protein
VFLEWTFRTGEWTLLTIIPTTPDGQYVRRVVCIISPCGPPFVWRRWHRENKDWERFTLDHVDNIEEAKACLAVSLRMA